MIYFTADTHFGHDAIIKMCQRPFKNIEDMNETLICKWNKKVNGSDTVYIIGEFFENSEKRKNTYFQGS